MRWWKEKLSEILFMVAATVSILAVILICVFLFANGIPAMQKIGVFDFVLGRTWKASNNEFGVLPMVLGSFFVTGTAILIGVPIGIFTSIYMARYCNKKVYHIVKPAIELLAGIPSVIYGFFGLVVLVPWVRNNIGGDGSSILTASILLGMMILPTIIGVSETALRSVPDSYYEGALALGATQERSIFCVVLPTAKSGIVAGVILGIGRAIGETMAVIMVAGNQPRIPNGILKGTRTMTANIVIEMGYATDLHREALIATGLLLFIFILIINVLFSLLKGRER